MMDKSTILKRMNAVFCDVFDDGDIKISENTVADDIEDWDSISHITLVTALEHEFNLQFNLKEIAKLNNVGGMVEMIMKAVKNNE